jgi:ABC-type transporter lipoprotein component MlaA
LVTAQTTTLRKRFGEEGAKKMITFDEDDEHKVAWTAIMAITELARRLARADKLRQQVYDNYIDTRAFADELQKENNSLKNQNAQLQQGRGKEDDEL